MSEKTSSRAIWSFVCGLLAWMGCSCFAAIPAIVLGSGDPSDLARVGRILGWIQLIFACALLLFALGVLAVAIFARAIH